MKKASIFLMILTILVLATNAVADSFWYKGGKWWIIDRNGELHPTETKPLNWKPSYVDFNFPNSMITDQSVLCKQHNGMPVCCLGLTPTAGCNLRSTTSINGELIYKDGHQEYEDSTIKKKLHGNVTVYVHFRFFDESDDEWYYATCADGTTGYLIASRILIYAID